MEVLITVILMFCIYVGYMMYFKEYMDVRQVFKVLEKTLDTRDLLVLKILPEVKLKKLVGRVTMLIDKRLKQKKMGYTVKMYTDIELNKELKSLYEELNKLNNPIIKETLKSLMNLEAKLKKLREEYNFCVEQYNHNLVSHKFVCMRLLRMKPLDIYGKKNK